MRHQIATNSAEVLDELLYQSDSDRVIGERQIFKRAQAAGVIDERLFEHLNELYGLRNQVVHRYIISEITTADVARIAEDYRRTISVVSHFISEIEREQIRLGVGMTHGIILGEATITTANMAARKHGHTSRIILPRR